MSENIAVLADKAQKPDFQIRLLKRMDIDSIVYSDEYKAEGEEIAQNLDIEGRLFTW